MKREEIFLYGYNSLLSTSNQKDNMKSKDRVLNRIEELIRIINTLDLPDTELDSLDGILSVICGASLTSVLRNLLSHCVLWSREQRKFIKKKEKENMMMN